MAGLGHAPPDALARLVRDPLRVLDRHRARVADARVAVRGGRDHERPAPPLRRSSAGIRTMILGALAMVVANGATLLGARAILARIGTGRPAPDAVLFLVLRLLLISAAVVLAGLTRTLHPWGLGLAGTAACAVLLARGAHRNLPRILPFPWSPWLTAVAALVLVRVLLQVWFFAPAFGDVLSYHLPKVAEWVRAGAFTREMGSDPRVPFPAGFEL